MEKISFSPAAETEDRRRGPFANEILIKWLRPKPLTIKKEEIGLCLRLGSTFRLAGQLEVGGRKNINVNRKVPLG